VCRKRDKAPDAGWLREIYYHLGKLALAEENRPSPRLSAAERLQGVRQADYTHYSFFGGTRIRTRFCPTAHKRDRAGRVYALAGFEFTEYYFVVSDDRQELIGIDAGTRPDAAKAAYEALRAYAPNLPELTTVFVTHSHWDHVGGHTYFRGLNPRLHFYARSNYGEEIGANSVRRPFSTSILRRRLQPRQRAELQAGHHHRSPHRAEDRRKHASSSFLSKEAKLTMRCSSTCRIRAFLFVGDFIMLISAHRSSRRATFRGCWMPSISCYKRIRSICSMATSRSRGISPPPRCWRSSK